MITLRTIYFLTLTLSQRNYLGSLPYDSLTSSIKIGEQTWTSENLNVITFQNGDTIAQAQSAEEWKQAFEQKTPAWCWYEKNGELIKESGRIYNFYAIYDERGLAPKGWKIPSSDDYLKLHTFLESTTDPCIALREPSAWSKTIDDKANTGFNAFPFGYRGEYGFRYDKAMAKFWTTTEVSSDYPAGFIDFYNIDRMGSCGIAYDGKDIGAYVRCIKIK